jgi:dephospho-CoA kinase
MRGEGFRGIAVVVIPLLYEVGAESGFRVVVAVGCSAATQRARLMSRGLTDAQCRERMDAQWPQARKLEKADFVIWNDSPLPVLDQQVRRVVDRIGARMRTN